MKKIVGVIIFIIVITVGVFVVYRSMHLNNEGGMSVNSVKVIQNNFNSDEKEVIYVIQNDYIKKIEKIYNKLLKSDTNYYDLALAGTTEIVLNEEITIEVQLDNPELCRYTGLGLSEFVDTPQELIDWINKVLEK